VLVEAAAARWFPDAPLPAALGLAVAFFGSTAAGALFHRYVEAPLTARAAGRSTEAPARPVLADDDEAQPASSAPR